MLFRSCLTVFSICADTEAEALELSRSRDLWFIRLLRGNPGPFPSIQEASDYEYSDGELAALADNKQKRAVGTPDQVWEQLIALVERFKLDELMIITITHDVEARRNSYKLIASSA